MLLIKICICVLLSAMRIFALFGLFLSSQMAQAQSLPLGLYEGLMGNSGVALYDSKAASYYNPSLLKNRQDSAFSINGTTIGTVTSKSDDTRFSSQLGLAPSYLSSIIVGSALVHDFFVANLVSSQFVLNNQSGTSIFEAQASLSRIHGGYTMAFRDFPFALQALFRYNEFKTFGFIESSQAPNISTTAKVSSEYKSIKTAIGLSTHVAFEHYTFGVNYVSRGYGLYKKNQNTSKSFSHNAPNTGDYTIIENNDGQSSVVDESQRLSIGHGFRAGSHEFLTDSIFAENSDSLNKYNYFQTFGYRLNSDSGHQYLCGLSHRFGPDIKYFGQSIYASTGYSWTTRALRSAIGLYYSAERATSEASSAGFTFASEFAY